MWPFKRKSATLSDTAANELSDTMTEAMRSEARRNPGGWVYKIDGNFAPGEGVPPEAIVGAYKVDADGNLTGEFTPNPNYRRK